MISEEMKSIPWRQGWMCRDKNKGVNPYDPEDYLEEYRDWRGGRLVMS